MGSAMRALCTPNGPRGHNNPPPSRGRPTNDATTPNTPAKVWQHTARCVPGAGCGTRIRGSSATGRATRALCRPNESRGHNDIPSGRDMLTNDEMIPTNIARTRRGAADGAAGAGFGADLAATSAVAAGALASRCGPGRPVRPPHRRQTPRSRTPRTAEPSHGDIPDQADASRDGIPRKRSIFAGHSARSRDTQTRWRAKRRARRRPRTGPGLCCARRRRKSRDGSAAGRRVGRPAVRTASW